MANLQKHEGPKMTELTAAKQAAGAGAAAAAAAGGTAAASSTSAATEATDSKATGAASATGAAGAGVGAVGSTAAAGGGVGATDSKAAVKVYNPRSAAAAGPDSKSYSAQEPLLLIVSGAQGGGKTTLAVALKERYEKEGKVVQVIPPIDFMRNGGYYQQYMSKADRKKSPQQKNIPDEMNAALKAKQFSVIIVVLSLRTKSGRDLFFSSTGQIKKFKTFMEFWGETDMHVSLLKGMEAISKRPEPENGITYGLTKHLPSFVEPLQVPNGAVR